MGYFVKTPWWLSRLVYPKLIWKMPPEKEPAVYLTFDDGPHLTATRFVLDTLDEYEAKASFFCVGKNVLAHPELYNEMVDKGHTVGNHTHNHINGWETGTNDYLGNISMAASCIKSSLFRPPYGKMTRKQARQLLDATRPWKIYMWDILSGDFDRAITGAQCADNVISYLRPGSIVNFHDSEKAWQRMSYALPEVLEFCRKNKWKLKALPKN